MVNTDQAELKFLKHVVRKDGLENLSLAEKIEGTMGREGVCLQNIYLFQTIVLPSISLVSNFMLILIFKTESKQKQKKTLSYF